MILVFTWTKGVCVCVCVCVCVYGPASVYVWPLMRGALNVGSATVDQLE